jgi:DNA-binding CsgD family transcriptional regulator
MHPDPSLSESIDLALVWQRLLEGRLFVCDSWCLDGRCFVVLERGCGLRLPRPSGVQILERVFDGQSQKALANELGLATATIACHSMRALKAFSRQHRVSRAPIVLIMAALAARGLPLGAARFEELYPDARWVISVEVPGRSFRERLSHSEWEVARLAIEGQAHVEIARARGTSVRTIANQLAAVFEKLGTFGRAALRAQAVREAAVDCAASHAA